MHMHRYTHKEKVIFKEETWEVGIFKWKQNALFLTFLRAAFAEPTYVLNPPIGAVNNSNAVCSLEFMGSKYSQKCT